MPRPPLIHPLVNAHHSERRCLWCPMTFRSTGPGHRMCKACRQRFKWGESVGVEKAGTAVAAAEDEDDEL